MAATPHWKVYSASGEYMAACREVEGAAALVALYGRGATIRWGHRKREIMWTEGQEKIPASESYDVVADVVNARFEEWMKRRWPVA